MLKVEMGSENLIEAMVRMNMGSWDIAEVELEVKTESGSHL